MSGTKKIIFLQLILIFICAEVFSLEKRPERISLKISIIIPCHYKHAEYLPSLLQAFSQQSVLPHEVVISLSDCNKISKNFIESINLGVYPFRLKLLTFKNAVSEGGNRNYGCSQALGDVLICHDADDLPHPQRVEIIKYFFEVYEVDHLMHRWADNLDQLSYFKNLDEIGWFHLPEYVNDPLGSGVYTNGPVAISRKIFDAIKWDATFRTGIDVDFNKKVYSRFSNTIVLEESLYIYRHKLSSYKK